MKLPLSIARLPSDEALLLHPTAGSGMAAIAAIRLDGVRVIVVDDDRDAVALLTAILTSVGAVVRGSASASEALAAVREWRPDVLVSDIEMPGEDGYSLIQKLRAMDPSQGARTPAVALTAYGRREDRVRSLSAGYSMHVAKPVDPGELTAVIASLAGWPLSGSVSSTD